MTSTWKITSRAVPRDEANKLSDYLEQVFPLDIGALALFETDEAKELWTVEAYLEEDPGTHRSGEHREILSVEPMEDIDWVSASQASRAPIFADRFFVHGAHDRDKDGRPCECRPGGPETDTKACKSKRTKR